MSSRIYFDTAPLIYFLDNTMYCEKVRDFIFENYKKDAQFYTSVITDMEYSVKPYQDSNFIKVQKYNAFLSALDFKKIDINKEIADLAAKLRGKYPFLKSMDSLQIASCIFYDCDVFFSNDTQLRQVTEIKCIFVCEL